MSQLERISPDFRDSLLEKFSQCGCQKVPSSIGTNEDEQKKDQINDIVGSCSSFCERIVRDWAMGLEDDERSKAGEVLKKIENYSASSFILAMKESGASCPFCTLGELITLTLKGQEPAAETEVVIVQEESGPPATDKLEGGLPI